MHNTLFDTLRALVTRLWRISPVTCVVSLDRTPDLRRFRRLRSRGFRKPIGLLLFMFLPLFLVSWAGEAAVKKEKVELKTVSGHVSGVNRGFIAVEYGVDTKKRAAFEMALPIDENATLGYAALLNTLKVGDTVLVEYEQRTAHDEQGKATRVTRAATKVTLLQQAPAIVETPESGESSIK